jgi:hypothetical protein
MILRDATIAAQVFQLAASFFGNTLKDMDPALLSFTFNEVFRAWRLGAMPLKTQKENDNTAHSAGIIATAHCSLTTA